MIVKYIGETDYSLTYGKEYEVIGMKYDSYQMVDNSGEAYYFPTEFFEIIKE